jgi:hypothetical protein
MSNQISDAVTALSALAAPNPATINSPPQPPSTWENASATGTNLLTTTAQLMGVLYGASPEMKTVGSDLSTALADVATVVQQIADQLSSLAAQGTDISSAMAALQKGLALAQTLAPGGGSTVLSSGSQLFGQIQNLLTDLGSAAAAAAVLAQLDQQLTLLSTQLKPS